MADLKAAKIPETNKPVDAEPYQYVTIPELDMFDHPITININEKSFGAGTHYLPAELAGEVARLLRVREEADRRILQPKQDQRYRRQLAGRQTPLTEAEAKS